MAELAREDEGSRAARITELDVAIIGAGFSGIYALHRLRSTGLRVRAYDEAGDVGGTWWWNRYPGARVDFPGGPFYCYTFSNELVQGWDWKETQPDQESVLGYLRYVADRLDLRRDIELRTRITSAVFDESGSRWLLTTSNGERVSAQFLVSAVGTLSAPFRPNIPGLEDFAGETYHTGWWPQDRDVDFRGKRVGLIGTGSSGVQIAPVIARTAAQLTVFQRTPQFILPARNRALDPGFVQNSKEHWADIRKLLVAYGRPFPPAQKSVFDDTEEERQRTFEEAWEKGGMAVRDAYSDLLTDEAANAVVSDFLRGKIQEIVTDPETAKKLLPSYFFGTKRQIMDQGYYEMFNLDTVSLVDVREEPISGIYEGGVRTDGGDHPLDVLVLATGYDAMTGALTRLNPVGRGGLGLSEKWSTGARTYLGMGVAGFPNLFMIHGPETPSVMFHMPLGSESQGDWIADCISHMREHGFSTIEPLPDAEADWGHEVQELANRTLYPRTDSWFTGANIPGKPREFVIYLAGARYHKRIHEISAEGFAGFSFDGDAAGEAERSEARSRA